mmetsp:Transcript_33140/g.73023  ORF Transcript_33140/g.73023 Transcript_33140/m.73023 type:complete len:236 (+) Transcript_33140:434-1141(+)
MGTGACFPPCCSHWAVGVEPPESRSGGAEGEKSSPASAVASAGSSGSSSSPSAPCAPASSARSRSRPRPSLCRARVSLRLSPSPLTLMLLLFPSLERASLDMDRSSSFIEGEAVPRDMCMCSTSACADRLRRLFTAALVMASRGSTTTISRAAATNITQQFSPSVATTSKHTSSPPSSGSRYSARRTLMASQLSPTMNITNCWISSSAAAIAMQNTSRALHALHTSASTMRDRCC